MERRAEITGHHHGAERPAAVCAGSPVGRRELLGAARAALADCPGVLLHGPAGIGKSALVAALTASSAAPVLRCSPAPEDARLPFAGLVDLFAGVPECHLDALAPEPRTALRAALLCADEPADGGRDRLAVRLAVLGVLRALALTGPVLLVVDGLQWLDGPSADALGYAVRRLDGTALRMVAAERSADGELPEMLRCCPPGTAELAVPPLPDMEVARLLRAALGAELPPALLRAVQTTAAGNPSYALELGRAARLAPAPADPGRALPVPRRLRAALLEEVRALPEAARHALLVTSAADRPSLSLLRAAGLPGPAAALARAERLGVASADTEGIVRFRHPVLRAAVYADAPEHGRRAAHALLAVAVTEPVERARHLALARPYEDETTARTLMAAAEHARRRGAADTAHELARLAARRTPADHQAAYADRLLAAAEYACDAGQLQEAGQAARTVLAAAGSAQQRVRARLVLLRHAGQALEGTRELIEEGLRDAAGDPRAQAWLYHWAAVRELLCGELAQAARYARRAARQAAAAGDTDTRTGALTTLARVRSLAGDPAAADAALAEAPVPGDGTEGAGGGPGGGPESRRLIRTRAVLALDADRVTEAGEWIAGLLTAIGESAGVEELMATRVARARVQVRAGHCREALRTAARCTRALAEGGVPAGPALYAAALAQAAGGTAEEARSLARQAVRACETDGDRLFLLRALAVLGQAELLAGDARGAAAAAEALHRLRELGATMRAGDAPLLHAYGDLAEALVVSGEMDLAGEVLGEARSRVSGATPGSVLSALDRAEGLREAGLGRAREGTVRLRAAVERLRRLPLPVDLVRTLVALGVVERRARRRGAAREALGEALRTATRIGAAPWAARAREELARLESGERTETGGPGLTPSEARIAELVGGGATNREVAAELFISVKTVEGALSRVYRKFGVRSRTALAHAMAVAVIVSGAAVDAADDDGQSASVAQEVTTSRPARPAPRALVTRRSHDIGG
ncbi:LuxR family transcriptional regulator [Streptomyces sp. NPDC047017]|uniref:helix-turn-helix transcriptional regulator n=1 Tax=Streptomyces sp. NPDC047017 TaxID=3155024 RepID=UPI0033C0B690